MLSLSITDAAPIYSQPVRGTRAGASCWMACHSGLIFFLTCSRCATRAWWGQPGEQLRSPPCGQQAIDVNQGGDS
jgi:hypothetical protein